MDKLAVIIPAAGSGSRMGSQTPKPFLMLRNKTILEHTIHAFAKLDFVSQIIIATSKERESEVESILNTFTNHVEILSIVEGGKERQDSIKNALSIVSDKVDLVAVHDAVRPFISAELIERCSKCAKEFGGAIIGVPAKDTIKEIGKDSVIKKTPDRSKLWQAQTPQIFQKKLLISAYKAATIEKFTGTDDASLVEKVGGTVKVIEGDRRNLKITYPIDLKIAELILDEIKEK
ncbi:MAG: 2-C-methyl-D-erythritol 4-phosphate cytidylyltransferase [Balneolaceae bacterium]